MTLNSLRAASAPTVPAYLGRALVLLAVVGAAPVLFRTLPAEGAALICFILGLFVALPGLALAAVQRGLVLREHTGGSYLRQFRQSAVLRVVWRLAVGTGLAALLLIRLSGGDMVVWAVTLSAAPATLVAIRMLSPIARAEYRGVHAEVRLQLWAQLVAIAVVCLLAVLVSVAWAPPNPAFDPGANSALVSEGLALHRLWAGIETALWGDAAALGLLPAWLMTTLMAVALAASAFAVSSLTLAAFVSPATARRGFAPASDAALGPAVSKPALVAAATLVTAGIVAASLAERHLIAQPMEARPVSQFQQAVEIVSDTYYRPGTHAEVSRWAREMQAADLAAVLALRRALDAGFDAMFDNVDPFLDAYYSLGAEYLRMFDFLRDAASGVFGGAQDRLAERLDAQLALSLSTGAPFAAYEELAAMLSASGAAAESGARAAGWTEAYRVTDTNPALIRVEASFDAFPPLPELTAPSFVTSLETRAGAGLTAGVLTALIARRVAQRLAVRGVLGLAARGLMAAVPLVGIASALGTDAAMLAVEEHLNRGTFRAEIIAEIEAQRSAAHAVFAR